MPPQVVEGEGVPLPSNPDNVTADASNNSNDNNSGSQAPSSASESSAAAGVDLSVLLQSVTAPIAAGCRVPGDAVAAVVTYQDKLLQNLKPGNTMPVRKYLTTCLPSLLTAVLNQKPFSSSGCAESVDRKDCRGTQEDAYATFIVDCAFKPILEFCLEVVRRTGSSFEAAANAGDDASASISEASASGVEIACEAGACLHLLLRSQNPFFQYYEYDEVKALLRNQRQVAAAPPPLDFSLFDNPTGAGSSASDGNNGSGGGGVKNAPAPTPAPAFVAGSVAWPELQPSAPPASPTSIGPVANPQTAIVLADTWRAATPTIGQKFLLRGGAVAVSSVGEKVGNHFFIEVNNNEWLSMADTELQQMQANESLPVAQLLDNKTGPMKAKAPGDAQSGVVFPHDSEYPAPEVSPSSTAAPAIATAVAVDSTQSTNGDYPTAVASVPLASYASAESATSSTNDLWFRALAKGSKCFFRLQLGTCDANGPRHCAVVVHVSSSTAAAAASSAVCSANESVTSGASKGACTGTSASDTSSHSVREADEGEALGLGPLILNSDGTRSHISDWCTKSPQEQAKVRRMIAARNTKRRRQAAQLPSLPAGSGFSLLTCAEAAHFVKQTAPNDMDVMNAHQARLQWAGETSSSSSNDDFLTLALVDSYNQCFVLLRRDSPHLVALSDASAYFIPFATSRATSNTTSNASFANPKLAPVVSVDPVLLFNDEMSGSSCRHSEDAPVRTPPLWSAFVDRKCLPLNSYRLDLLEQFAERGGFHMLLGLLHPACNSHVTLGFVTAHVQFLADLAPHLRRGTKREMDARANHILDLEAALERAQWQSLTDAAVLAEDSTAALAVSTSTIGDGRVVAAAAARGESNSVQRSSELEERNAPQLVKADIPALLRRLVHAHRTGPQQLSLAAATTAALTEVAKRVAASRLRQNEHNTTSTIAAAASAVAAADCEVRLNAYRSVPSLLTTVSVVANAVKSGMAEREFASLSRATFGTIFHGLAALSVRASVSGSARSGLADVARAGIVLETMALSVIGRCLASLFLNCRRTGAELLTDVYDLVSARTLNPRGFHVSTDTTSTFSSSLFAAGAAPLEAASRGVAGDAVVKSLVFTPISKSLSLHQVLDFIESNNVVSAVFVGPQSHKALIELLSPMLQRMSVTGQLSPEACSVLWRAMLCNDDADIRSATKTVLKNSICNSVPESGPLASEVAFGPWLSSEGSAAKSKSIVAPLQLLQRHLQLGRYHLLGLLSTFATSSLEHLFVEPIAQASSRPQCENSDFIDYIQLESSDRAVEDVVEVLSALALGASCCPGPKDVARLGVGRGALTALLSIYSCKVIDMQKLVPAHYSAVASSLWALVGSSDCSDSLRERLFEWCLREEFPRDPLATGRSVRLMRACLNSLGSGEKLAVKGSAPGSDASRDQVASASGTLSLTIERLETEKSITTAVVDGLLALNAAECPSRVQRAWHSSAATSSARVTKGQAVRTPSAPDSGSGDLAKDLRNQFDFLEFLLKNSSLVLGATELARLWNAFVSGPQSEGKTMSLGATLLFGFLIRSVKLASTEPQRKTSTVAIATLLNLFEESMCLPKFTHHATASGFECFRRFFEFARRHDPAIGALDDDGRPGVTDIAAVGFRSLWGISLENHDPPTRARAVKVLKEMCSGTDALATRFRRDCVEYCHTLFLGAVDHVLNGTLFDVVEQEHVGVVDDLVVAARATVVFDTFLEVEIETPHSKSVTAPSLGSEGMKDFFLTATTDRLHLIHELLQAECALATSPTSSALPSKALLSPIICDQSPLDCASRRIRERRAVCALSVCLKLWSLGRVPLNQQSKMDSVKEANLLTAFPLEFFPILDLASLVFRRIGEDHALNLTNDWARLHSALLSELCKAQSSLTPILTQRCGKLLLRPLVSNAAYCRSGVKELPPCWNIALRTRAFLLHWSSERTSAIVCLETLVAPSLLPTSEQLQEAVDGQLSTTRLAPGVGLALFLYLTMIAELVDRVWNAATGSDSNVQGVTTATQPTMPASFVNLAVELAANYLPMYAPQAADVQAAEALRFVCADFNGDRESSGKDCTDSAQLQISSALNISPTVTDHVLKLLGWVNGTVGTAVRLPSLHLTRQREADTSGALHGVLVVLKRLIRNDLLSWDAADSVVKWRLGNDSQADQGPGASFVNFLFRHVSFSGTPSQDSLATQIRKLALPESRNPVVFHMAAKKHRLATVHAQDPIFSAVYEVLETTMERTAGDLGTALWSVPLTVCDVVVKELSKAVLDSHSGGVAHFTSCNDVHTGIARGNGARQRNLSHSCGLQNMGSTCYMNSVIQLLFANRAFRKIVFGIDFEQLERDHEELLAEAAAAAEPLPETGADTPSAGCSEIREYEKRSFSQSIKMLQNLQALFLFMQNSDRDSISPHCFVKSFRDDVGNMPNPTIQEDAVLYAGRLLDRFETVARTAPTQHCSQHPSVKVPDQSPSRLFSCEILSEFRGYIDGIPVVQHSRRETDSFIRIEVDGDKRAVGSAVETELRRKFGPRHSVPYLRRWDEEIKASAQRHGLQPHDDPAAKVVTYRRDYISRLPDTLLLQLKRFQYVQGTTVKLGGEMTFPLTLDMTPYTSTHDHAEGDAPKNNTQENSGLDQEKMGLYDLTGVVVHSGTATSGHYWTLIRDPVTNQWTECNDTNIVQFDETKLAEVCFGGKSAASKATTATDATSSIFSSAVSTDAEEEAALSRALAMSLEDASGDTKENAIPIGLNGGASLPQACHSENYGLLGGVPAVADTSKGASASIPASGTSSGSGVGGGGGSKEATASASSKNSSDADTAAVLSAIFASMQSSSLSTSASSTNAYMLMYQRRTAPCTTNADVSNNHFEHDAAMQPSAASTFLQPSTQNDFTDWTPTLDHKLLSSLPNIAKTQLLLEIDNSNRRKFSAMIHPRLCSLFLKCGEHLHTAVQGQPTRSATQVRDQVCAFLRLGIRLYFKAFSFTSASLCDGIRSVVDKLLVDVQSWKCAALKQALAACVDEACLVNRNLRSRGRFDLDVDASHDAHPVINGAAAPDLLKTELCGNAGCLGENFAQYFTFEVNNRFGIYKRNGQGDCNLDGVRVALFENPDESIRQASARFLIMVLRHDYTYTVAGSTSDRTLAHPDPCEEPLHAAALSWQLLGNRGFTRLPQIPGLYNWLDRESERAKARAFRAIRTGAELPEPVAKCAVSAVRNAEQASNGCANSVAEISSNNGSMESQNTEKELRDSNDDAADDSDDDDDDDAAALQLAMQMSMADEAHGDLRVETQSSNTGIGTSPTSVSVGVDGGHAHPMQKADEEEKPVACPLTGEHQMRVLPVSMMLLDAILSSTTLGLVLQHPDRSRQFFHFALDATGVASIPKVKTAETAKSQPPTGCHSADQATMATSGIENGTQRFASFSRAARLAASANGFLPALLQVLGRDFAGQQGMHVFLSIVAEPRSPATKEAGTGHIAPEQERVAQAIRCEGVGLPPAGIARSLPMMSLRYSPGYPSLNPLVPLLRQSHYRSQVPWCCVLQLVASLVTEEPLWKCIYVQLCRLRVPTQNEAPPQLEVGKGSTHARIIKAVQPRVHKHLVQKPFNKELLQALASFPDVDALKAPSSTNGGSKIKFTCCSRHKGAPAVQAERQISDIVATMALDFTGFFLNAVDLICDALLSAQSHGRLYVQCLRQVTERVVPQAAMDLDNFPGDLPAGSSSAFCTWLQPVADRLAKLLRALKTTTQSSWGGSAFAIVSVSAGPWHCDRCTLLNTSGSKCSVCDAPRPVPDVGVPTDTGKLTSCRWLFEAVEDVVQWMQDCAALRHGMSRHKADLRWCVVFAAEYHSLREQFLQSVFSSAVSAPKDGEGEGKGARSAQPSARTPAAISLDTGAVANKNTESTDLFGIDSGFDSAANGGQSGNIFGSHANELFSLHSSSPPLDENDPPPPQPEINADVVAPVVEDKPAGASGTGNTTASPSSAAIAAAAADATAASPELTVSSLTPGRSLADITASTPMLRFLEDFVGAGGQRAVTPPPPPEYFDMEDVD